MVALFAIMVMVRLGRTHHVLGIAAAITALASVTPLLLEAANQSPGVMETVAPLCFLAQDRPG